MAGRISYGVSSMVGTLRHALVRRPGPWIAVQDPAKWHYLASPNAEAAMRQHDAFTSILRKHGVQVHYHEENNGIQGDSDSIFAHDPMLSTPAGAIVMQLGKPLRQAEGDAMRKAVTKLGVPMLGQLQGDATAEGGDCLWLDSKTLAIGEGYRSNPQGIRQIADMLRPHGVTVVSYQLPHFMGKDACLHLQSLISFAGARVAVCSVFAFCLLSFLAVLTTRAWCDARRGHVQVVYKPLMPVALVRALEDRQVQMLDVPEQEFLHTMGTNVLCIKPGLVVALQGSPKTLELMQKAGVTVETFDGSELCFKTEGGPTCLVQPLSRSSD